MKQSEIMVSPITASLPGEKSQSINRKRHLSHVTYPHACLNGNHLNVTSSTGKTHIEVKWNLILTYA